MIAALYVETNGAYYDLDGVDPWDQVRDARLYDGPSPVVAHPPCPRWGKMWFGQPLKVKKTGHRKPARMRSRMPVRGSQRRCGALIWFLPQTPPPTRCG